MRLTVASSPHIRNPRRTAAIMGDVALALLPALAVGVAVHGIRALTTVLVTVIFAVGTEWLWGYFFTKKIYRG